MSHHFKSTHFNTSHLTKPNLNTPYLQTPHINTSSLKLTTGYLTSPNLTSPYHTSSQFKQHCVNTPHLISVHLTRSKQTSAQINIIHLNKTQPTLPDLNTPQFPSLLNKPHPKTQTLHKLTQLTLHIFN